MRRQNTHARERSFSLRRRDIGYIVAAALVGVPLNQVAFVYGTKLTTAATVGSTAASFRLGDRTIDRRGDRLTWTDPGGAEVLAGAHLDMSAAVRFCVDALGLPLAEALRMASLYPAEFLRLDTRHGRIARGHVADIVHLGADLTVRRTWMGADRS